MSKRKRKALIRIAERVALAILAVDILVYAFLVLGMSDRIRAAAQTRESLRRQVFHEELRIGRLKKYQAGIPEAKDQLAQFQADRIPSRRQAYSQAAGLVREVSRDSGVDVSAVTYKLHTDDTEPLERLAINVNVSGLYPSLLKFAHDLESAGDFLVIRHFSFFRGDNGTLALQISADLYLKR
jgi:Tfp pilus assembly protein PilO